MVRRLLAAVAALVTTASLVLVPTPTAGASGNLGWRASGYGSADCNQDGAHNVCFRYGPRDAYGNLTTVDVAFDSWVPWWCYIAWVSDGDANGRPLQYLWASSDPNRACIPWAGQWGDGSGYAEGIMGAGWPVDVGEVTVFPRSGQWARGTMWVIW